MQTLADIGDAEADRIVAAAIDAACGLGIRVSVAVVDRAGRLKRFARMDGAEIASITLAPEKAFSALANSCDTDELVRQAVSGSGLHGIESASGGAFTVVGGGVVLPYRGELVGAVGVSDGTVEEDKQCGARD